MSEIMMVSEIQVRSPFKDFFSIKPIILKAIEEDMKKYGYDESAPIVLWNEGNVVIDGHTRLQAAKNVGLKEIFVQFGQFDEQSAIEYAIHNQRDRRNMTDVEFMNCLSVIDKRRKRGPSKVIINLNNNPTELFNIIEDDLKIPSHEKTAILLGRSPSKVQEGRRILDSKNKKLKRDVFKGKKSVHAASEEIRKSKIKDPLAEAYRRFEKDMKRLIKNAIRDGITLLQIKQVVRETLKGNKEEI